jgi:cobalamin biosynthesis Mg chelatase CobN
LWHADPNKLHELSRTFNELTQKYGSTGGQLLAGNTGLSQYIAHYADAPGSGSAVLATAPGPGKMAALAPGKAMAKAAANAARGLPAVTGHILSLQQQVAQSHHPSHPGPMPTQESALALAMDILIAFSLFAAGYAGRRGSIG